MRDGEDNLQTRTRARYSLKRSALMARATIFVLLAASCLRVTMFARARAGANPIPIPTLLMPEEYINATISPGDGGILYAQVDGLYPFKNLGHRNVSMYYPVPPGAGEISVKMDDTSLDWNYSDENYPTVIGDFPMINWTVEPVPDNFTIGTYYEHPLPKIDGNYTFLYAMGTGRYLDTYAKQTTAYVRIRMDVAFDDLNVYTTAFNATTEEWIWNPTNYTLTQENGKWIILLTVVSDMWTPLVEDLLLTFKPRATSVFFNLYPNPAHLGQTVNLVGVLLDNVSNPLADATVELYYRLNPGITWFYAGSVTTNKYGVFKASGKPLATGLYLICTYYAGSSAYEQSFSFEILIVR